MNVLHEDPNGRIWIGTDGGLFRLDDGASGGGQPVKIDLRALWGDTRLVTVDALLAGADGDMRVGTNQGLLRVLADDRPLLFEVPPLATAKPPVREIVRGVDGSIWVAYPVGCSVSVPRLRGDADWTA